MASQAGGMEMNRIANQNEGYANDNVVAVTNQPVSRPEHDKMGDEDVPGDNLVLAVFSAIFCNIVLGGLAVWQGRKVKRLVKQGDYDAARKASFWTNVLTAVALITGGIAWIVAFRFWIIEDY